MLQFSLWRKRKYTLSFISMNVCLSEPVRMNCISILSAFICNLRNAFYQRPQMFYILGRYSDTLFGSSLLAGASIPRCSKYWLERAQSCSRLWRISCQSQSLREWKILPPPTRRPISPSHWGTRGQNIAPWLKERQLYGVIYTPEKNLLCFPRSLTPSCFPWWTHSWTPLSDSASRKHDLL